MITLKIIETDELIKKIENMYTSASPLEKEIYGNLIKMINEMSIDDSTTKGFVLRGRDHPDFILKTYYPHIQKVKFLNVFFANIVILKMKNTLYIAQGFLIMKQNVNQKNVFHQKIVVTDIVELCLKNGENLLNN